MKHVEMLSLILSWNRPHLIEKTIDSYFDTVSVPSRLIVVDNASNHETTEVLKRLSDKYKFKVVFLDQNIGALAFNQFLGGHQQDFVHFSENDLEYRNGWDIELLSKLHSFKRLGQISLYSPFPEKNLLQNTIKNVRLVNKGNKKIYVTTKNVMTPSIVKNELFTKGLRWNNIKTEQLCYPSDSKFSRDVQQLGYLVAWNDQYLVLNWGHSIEEIADNPDYYIKNHQFKPWLSLRSLKNKMERSGYYLEKGQNGRYIFKKNK